MLRLPAGWRVGYGANVVEATSSELGARLRYHERLRPQPAFATIVDQMLAADREMRVHEVGELVRVVTEEGEYGAAVALHGLRGHARALRWVGAVFLGEFATALDVLALAPAHFGEIEMLALGLLRGQRFELGGRPRPFFYEPPRGWQGLPAGDIANWYPPDFPANRSIIVVPPARVGDDLEQAIGDLSAGLVTDEQEREALSSAAGLAGVHVRVRGRRDGREIHRELAGFVAADRTYQLRLETLATDRLVEIRAVFRAVAVSVQPLPERDEARTGRAFAAHVDLFDHWAG